MADAPSIPDLVAAMRRTTTVERQKYLQKVCGSRSDDPKVLHWRALYFTALREANLWPPIGVA